MSTREFIGEIPKSLGSGKRKVVRRKKITGSGDIAFSPELSTVYGVSVEVIDASSVNPSARASVATVNANTVTIAVEEDTYAEEQVTGTGSITLSNISALKAVQANISDHPTSGSVVYSVQISSISSNTANVVVMATSQGAAGSVTVTIPAATARSVRVSGKGLSQTAHSVKCTAVGH